MGLRGTSGGMALRNIGAIAFPPRALHLARYPSPVGAERVLADHPDAIACMAGPMFGHTASRSCGGGVKTCTRWFEPARGVDLLAAISNAGITISIVDGEAEARSKDQIAPGAAVAIQLYPTIAWDGVARGSGTGESSVAGLGLLRDGSLLYLVASGGSPHALGQEFVARGALAAGYTDAGSSAALYMREGGFRGAHAQSPQVPGWLLVEKTTGLWIPPDTKRAALGLAALVAGYFAGRWLF